MYTEQSILEAQLDDACRRLRKALTPFAIARKERRDREQALYIMLAWEGKRK